MPSAPESLKVWRIDDAKLTQEEAATRAGVTAATWCDWENGKKVPTVDRAEDIEVLTGRKIRVTDWAEYSRTLRERRRAAGGEHA